MNNYVFFIKIDAVEDFLILFSDGIEEPWSIAGNCPLSSNYYKINDKRQVNEIIDKLMGFTFSPEIVKIDMGVHIIGYVISEDKSIADLNDEKCIVKVINGVIVNDIAVLGKELKDLKSFIRKIKINELLGK
jgi:hypothetical protein